MHYTSSAYTIRAHMCRRNMQALAYIHVLFVIPCLYDVVQLAVYIYSEHHHNGFPTIFDR